MTRAKDRFFFTSATDYGGLRGHRPSRFIGEALGRKVEGVRGRLSAEIELERSRPAAAEADARIPAMGADDVLTVSYSQIEDYRRCPLRYRFAHVLRIPVLPTPQLIYGNALHRAVSDFLTRKREGLAPTLDDLERTFRATWLSEGFISVDHETERFEAGLAALRRFHASENVVASPELVEQRFSFMLGKDRVVGRWDRVDQTADGPVVTDYKTTALEADDDVTPKRRAIRDLQLRVYALAHQRMYKRLPAKVALEFLETGARGETVPTEEEIRAVAAYVSSTAARIRQREFAATPELRTCGACPYEPICPESWNVRQAAH
jgi:DNA helicase-2/ATP-dependent DNA helicase PcrA